MKKFLPNIITLLSLELAFIAMVCANLVQTNKIILLIPVICVVLDSLDGIVARKLNATSDIGMNLDSLSDVVCFGAMPAILLINYYGLTTMNLFIFSFLIIFGALRLARFNSNPTTHGKNPYFEGIPITTTGLVVPLILYLQLPLFVAIIIIEAMSFLMVSKVRVPKLSL